MHLNNRKSNSNNILIESYDQNEKSNKIPKDYTEEIIKLDQAIQKLMREVSREPELVKKEKMKHIKAKKKWAL